MKVYCFLLIIFGHIICDITMMCMEWTGDDYISNVICRLDNIAAVCNLYNLVTKDV